MSKLKNQVITGFFVFIFGIAWYFSTKYYVRPKQYQIFVFDHNGISISQKDLRISFSTQEAAFSYAKEYQKLFPEQKFFVETLIPKSKRRLFLIVKSKKNYK